MFEVPSYVTRLLVGPLSNIFHAIAHALSAGIWRYGTSRPPYGVSVRIHIAFVVLIGISLVPLIMFFWGVVMLSMSFVKSYGGLVVYVSAVFSGAHTDR